MLEVKHLTKKYGSHEAVSDLSFTADKGEIVGLLGPNGAGKSTTMNMLTGYISATKGEILVDGDDILKKPKKVKKKIGYMPEIPPVYNDMTVKEYLNFAADLKGIRRKEKKAVVAQIMEETGTVNVKNKLIKNLSKGYKQRVDFAQAIMGDPEVIILDEPTAGLDPRQIKEMRDKIISLKEDHIVILSSHILPEIQEVCDHVLIISNGHLVLSDSTENLLSNKDETLEDIFLQLTDETGESSVLRKGRPSDLEGVVIEDEDGNTETLSAHENVEYSESEKSEESDDETDDNAEVNMSESDNEDRDTDGVETEADAVLDINNDISDSDTDSESDTEKDLVTDNESDTDDESDTDEDSNTDDESDTDDRKEENE